MSELLDRKMIDDIKSLLVNARKSVASVVNTTLLQTYWQIGKIIVEDEQKHKDRAEYGKQTLKLLSKELTTEFGKGFSVANLQFMRRFYVVYQKQQTLSVKLTWSHYCELLSISDDNKRSFYERECENAHWSVRELQRQIDSSLYERLLLSIGIILCTDKGNIDMQYALGGLSNNIFASKYVLYLPDKEQLIAQVEKVIDKWNDKK